jgi:hypothetical protein
MTGNALAILVLFSWVFAWCVAVSAPNHQSGPIPAIAVLVSSVALAVWVLA